MEDREPGMENAERANVGGLSFARSEFLIVHSWFSNCLFSMRRPPL
jgi:hypothetical protein